jgi:aldehyde dehydrogenase (NAD+)
VAATAAQTVKRVTLELGGKSPSLVFDDADMQQAVNGALYGIFYNAGQCCEARSRVLVQENIADEFIALFTAKAHKLRVGNPEDPQTQIGAITTQEQLDKIKSYCEIGASEGATLLLGGGPANVGEGFEEGKFWNVSAYETQPAHRLSREEVFGPVASFTRFKDEAQAIALANDSEYGLSATIWSQNIGRANRAAKALRTGTVAINTPYAVFPGIPFGGYKQSGYGRELGIETMALYSEIKSIITYIGEKPIDHFGV